MEYLHRSYSFTVMFRRQREAFHIVDIELIIKVEFNEYELAVCFAVVAISSRIIGIADV